MGTMRRKGYLLIGAFVCLFAATSCGGGGGGAVASGDDLVAAAEEEGEVTLYAGGHTRESLELLEQKFEEKYDIELTYVRDDSGAAAQKVQSELTSGNLRADVVSLTDTPTFQRWDREGITTSVDVPNRNQILDSIAGDADSPHIPISLVPLGIMYNDSRLDESQLPDTWSDFATGEQGMTITVANPNTSGTALQWAYMVRQIAGESFFENLAQQDVITADSSVTIPQFVVTGEAGLGAPAIESAVLTAAEGGEPIDMIYPEDGVPVFTSNIAALNDSPHPNAAALLVRYQLSKELQAAATEQVNARSVLKDVPAPEGLPELGDDEIRSPNYNKLADEAESVRERYSELFE